MNTKTKKSKGCFAIFLYVLSSLVVIFILLYIFFLRGAFETLKESGVVAQQRDLGLSFFQYANDHAGKYPEGKSSTEIFQKLLDGGYLGDEDGHNGAVWLLYYPMPGKVQAATDTKILKPENICWDVTCCVDTQSPPTLPLLFLTGYKVTYQVGASAVPLPHPPRTWWDWWHGKDYPDTFIVVSYKSGYGMCVKSAPDGTIPNFIPADFDPEGKTYRQLTPDGELPP